MIKLYELRINGHTVVWFKMINCYLVRIDGLTDLQHQAMAWSFDSLQIIETKLLRELI